MDGNAIDELLEDLKRIPTDITSELNIDILKKKISQELAQELGNKLSL